MNLEKITKIVEAGLFAAGKPLTVDNLLDFFPEEQRPGKEHIQSALVQVQQAFENSGIELKEVSSGYRFQVRQEYTPWISRMWEEKPPRYSRALLETLALIAYRQPITRAEIEEIRGVSVSSSIIKTLHEREWIRVVGNRDIPGRPSLYATTKQLLDYFGLRSLDELPTLSDLRDIDQFGFEFDKNEPVDDNVAQSSLALDAGGVALELGETELAEGQAERRGEHAEGTQIEVAASDELAPVSEEESVAQDFSDTIVIEALPVSTDDAFSVDDETSPIDADDIVADAEEDEVEIEDTVEIVDATEAASGDALEQHDVEEDEIETLMVRHDDEEEQDKPVEHVTELESR